MRRQGILTILVLLLSLLICTGCGSSNETAIPDAAPALERTAADTEEAVTEETAFSVEEATAPTSVEDVIGIFEGLEDNHTAIFSFEGVEKAFYFDAPEIQQVLWGAVIGSSYTLSYKYEETEFYGGLIIYEISE